MGEGPRREGEQGCGFGMKAPGFKGLVHSKRSADPRCGRQGRARGTGHPGGGLKKARGGGVGAPRSVCKSQACVYMVPQGSWILKEL